MQSRDQRLRVVAQRQHGVFTLRQAIHSGFTRSTVARRLGSGTWEEVVPRVYRMSAARVVDWRQETIALTLVTGGVAGGRSAGALFNLVAAPTVPEILTRRAPRQSLRAIFRSTSELPNSDCTDVGGIPSTNPIRTLIDLGGLLPRSAFEDILDIAIVQRLVRVERLRARARELRAPRRNGCTVVLELLEQRHPDLARAANLWEAKVVRIVRRLGMPDPEVNYRVVVGGKRRYLDLAWPEAKVAVEFDGFVPHSTRRVFDDDRLRQNHLVDEDWALFRVTKTMLDEDPDGTFRPIAAKVARNSPQVVKHALL
jgi:very-short-patch-repair endonuclease